MTLRKEGFYWVKIKGSPDERWEPAEWVTERLGNTWPHGHWKTIGWDVPVEDSELAEIGDELLHAD